MDMLGNKLDETLIQEVLGRAKLSPRLRANHLFHHPTERLQRMVNIALHDSYFAPHRHQDPDKLEIFTVLKGQVMVIAFTETGEIADQILLDSEASPNSARQIEIPAGTWHTLLVMSSEVVLFEIIDGFYDAKTHKRFAPWAPIESDLVVASAYLKELRQRCS
jgi:cupin fold WbuC family metalloprotein